MAPRPATAVILLLLRELAVDCTRRRRDRAVAFPSSGPVAWPLHLLLSPVPPLAAAGHLACGPVVCRVLWATASRPVPSASVGARTARGDEVTDDVSLAVAAVFGLKLPLSGCLPVSGCPARPTQQCQQAQGLS